MCCAAGVVLIILTPGCDQAEQKAIHSTKTTMSSNQTISTIDFDVSLPAGWNAVPSETRAGLFVYQSPEGNSRLTVSVWRDTAQSTDLQADLVRVSTIRRKAESSQASNLRLTDMEVQDNTQVSSKWYGNDAPTARRTATLVQLSNAKLFTVYIECLDASDADAKQLSDHIIRSFAAK